MFDLFENILSKGNIPSTSNAYNQMSSNPQITGIQGGGITPQNMSKAKAVISTENQLKQKFGFNDKDIQFLRVAKEKGYEPKKAMDFIQNKKAQEAMAQEQARQGEDLGFFGGIKEGAKGIGQAGMYIPEAAGFVGSMIPGAMGEIAGFAGSALGVERENNPFYTSLKEGQRATQRAGQMVTGAGVDNLNLTEKQKEARRTGAMLALTAPVPVKGLGLVKGTGLGATALRGGLAGAQGTTAYMAGSEGRLPTAPELAMGTAGGAVLGPALEKAVIPGIAKGAEMVNRKLNPSKFVQQIDDETIGLVRKAVRPSVTGVDSVSKFDVQDEKLLQGVKEVVKQGKKPRNARELMDAVADTKKAIWAKVQESNKAVVKTTSGDEIATKVRNIVNDSEYDELFANNPSLEAELLRFADDVVTNKRFQNLSQEKLQNYLVDINGRLPQTAFQKSLASNPTQTAKDTLIAKAYKEILDDNLEQAVGMAGKETRIAYGAVRQLEKDFAKRYAVYLRQNPQGLADMFGMEGFADMAVGLLTGSPAQVGRGVVMQGVKKLIKSQNNPDTIIRDIFNLQGKLKNVKAPIVKPKTPLLPARTSTTPEPIVTPQTSSRAVIQESKKGLSSNIKRPNGTPIRNSQNNTSSSNTKGSKQTIVSPKKPVEKTVKPNKLEVRIGNDIKTDNISIEGRKFNGRPIEIDGKEVGGILYRVYPNETKTIELSKIEIYPEFRGNNYARKVIEKLFIDNPNSTKISLSSAKTAEPIWEKIGFKYANHIGKEGKTYTLSRDEFLNSKIPSPQKIVKPRK